MVDPWAHALLDAVTQRCCAARSDRRVQSRFGFQRWAPAPREITVAGSEPVVSQWADGVTPSRSLWRARALLSSFVPNLWRAVAAADRSQCRDRRRHAKNLRDHRMVKQDGVPIQARLPPLPPCAMGPRRSFRSTQTRRRPMASAILTTHGHVRRTQRPDCGNLAAPPLAPVRGRNNNLRCCCQMGCFKERSNSLSRSSEHPVLQICVTRSTKIDCGKMLFFSPSDPRFAQPVHIRRHTPNCVLFSRRRWRRSNRNSGSVDLNRRRRGCGGCHFRRSPGRGRFTNR